MVQKPHLSIREKQHGYFIILFGRRGLLPFFSVLKGLFKQCFAEAKIFFEAPHFPTVMSLIGILISPTQNTQTHCKSNIIFPPKASSSTESKMLFCIFMTRKALLVDSYKCFNFSPLLSVKHCLTAVKYVIVDYAIFYIYFFSLKSWKN